ncbi:hypothetical protein ACFU44_00980 [Nocardia rhizosphaerihabitans]|uniref:hypothetical protein n=1 Tax=Nocardia rhizosphaerihabitans TaxID=1691570 RepID=UPI00366FB81B
MPGSPVHTASTAVGEAAEGAFHALGGSIAAMANVAGSGAKTYEHVDTGFREEFQRLGRAAAGHAADRR